MGKLSSQSSKQPLLRRQKGWFGFVHSYNNYIKNGYYDQVKWGEGTKKPKKRTKDHMGVERIIF